MNQVVEHAVLVEMPVTGSLAALTKQRPIGMLPVANRPLVQYWLESLHRSGIRHITLVLSQFPEQVRGFVEQGARWGFESVNYVTTAALDDPQVLLSRCNTSSEGNSLLLSMNGFPPRELVSIRPEEPKILAAEVSTPLADLRDYWQVNMNQLSSLENRFGQTPEIHISPLADCDSRARFEGYVHIDDHASVAAQCDVKNSVIGAGAEIAEGSRLINTVVLAGTAIASHLSLSHMLVDGSVIYSVNHDALIDIPDPELTCTTADPALTKVSFLQKFAALVLMLFTLPWWLVSKWIGEKEKYLLTITCGMDFEGNDVVEQLSLRLLASDNPGVARLPWLWQVVKGRLPLIGIRELTLEVPPWAEDQMSVRPGVISLADISLGANASSEEIAVVNNYQMNAFSTWDRLKLIPIWWLSLMRRTR